MTSYRNTATIEATPGSVDRARVRPLLPALVLALAVALGAAASMGITTRQPVEVAPSYQGDWKDAFLSGSAATGYEGDWKDSYLGSVDAPVRTDSGDWKDSYLGSVDAPVRTHSGDWKDLFLPEVAGR